MKITVHIPAMVAVVAVIGCAAPAWKRAPHDALFQRAPAPILHTQPYVQGDSSDWWNVTLHSTLVPLGRLISPARYIDRVWGSRPALDINAFGKVPDSTWFTNRIGRRSMQPTELRQGPNRHGPAPGKLTIISGKPEGITPGMVLRDAAGVVWFVKFDPPAYPDLSTGAEIIASRILHAAGYFVPEMFLVDLDKTRLTLAPDATTRDDYNRVIPFDDKQLSVLLTHLNTDSRGYLRALFSRAVEGTPLGPSYYRGVRLDDPNDRIPHERRRSLRGLWVFYAWLNNTDTRNQNTLDTFVPGEPDRGDGRALGYVKHYLIDFGDSLGAVGNRDKYIGEGYEYRVDWAAMFTRALSLGLRYPYWLSIQRGPYRSIGPFESEIFDPARWHPLIPNPAFSEATEHDNLWAASLLARFSPKLIRAAVATAEFHETGADEWVTTVLLARRKKLLQYLLRRMLPLDDPMIEDGYTARFTDLAYVGGLTDKPGAVAWSARWNRTGGRDQVLGSGVADEPRVDLRSAVRAIMTTDPAGFSADPYITLTVSRPQASSPALRLHIRVVKDYLLPVGLDREVSRAIGRSWGR